MLRRLIVACLGIVVSLGCSSEPTPGSGTGDRPRIDVTLETSSATRIHDESSEPVPAVELDPLPDRASPPEGPRETALAALEALREGDALRLWDLLPTSYASAWQEALRDQFAATDPRLFAAGVETIREAGRLCRQKREWIAASLASSPLITRDNALALADSTAEACDAILHSPLTQQETAREIDLRRFMSSSGNTLLSVFRDIAEQNSPNPLEGLFDVEITTQSEDEGQAELLIEFPSGESVPLKLQKLEDAWCPNILTFWHELLLAQMRSIARQTDSHAAAFRTRQYLSALTSLQEQFRELNAVESEVAFLNQSGPAWSEMIAAAATIRRLNSGLSTIEELIGPRWCRIQFDAVLGDEDHFAVEQQLSKLVDAPRRGSLLSGVENGRSWYDVEPARNLENLVARLRLTTDEILVEEVQKVPPVIHVRLSVK